MEAGEMSGGSRNQIEFAEDLITFFDEKSRAEGKIFIAYDTTTKAYCALSNREQSYGQWTNIWRLGLITKDKGGVDYQGRVIRLEKIKVGKTFTYLIKVADVNSPEHEEWVSKSKGKGVTGGAQGRAYGYA
jgi:hypothetical protein